MSIKLRRAWLTIVETMKLIMSYFLDIVLGFTDSLSSGQTSTSNNPRYAKLQHELQDQN